MNLHLQYYLNKFFPFWVKKPYVLIAKPRTIEEARIELAVYEISSMRKQDIELYLKRLSFEKINYRINAWLNMGYGYQITVNIDGEFLPKLQTIQIPEGVAVVQKQVHTRDALVVTTYAKKDWRPEDATKKSL